MNSRRDFLKYFLTGAGCFTAKACASPGPNIFSVGDQDNTLIFPQGIASGDPQEDAVMLWTRAVDKHNNTAAVDLVVQLTKDETFSDLILESRITATEKSDHTVRFFARGLASDSIYYYRFINKDMISSPIGRTRTAPKPDADRPVNFAWVSCQNFEAGFYGAWARLIHDDKQDAHDKQLDFILHLGDFIYETINAGFRDADSRALYGDSPYLQDNMGRNRKLPPLPRGGRKGKYGGHAASHLEDYRHIYKEYLKDPNLQAARARWPFICIWDDHEFWDNCWQSHLGHLSDQKGRLAANQAWFEYVPAVLSQSPPLDGLQSPAHDFKYTAVENIPFGDPGEARAELESNNQTAIHSIGIYRALRYGQHLKLILSDNRSYRSDHAIPEWWQKKYFADKPLLKTAGLLATLDNEIEKPAEIISNNGVSCPNPRRNRKPGSMFGELQKKWWKESVENTDATWKVWANSVPMMSLFQDRNEKKNTGSRYILHSDDAWDGYPAERQELLQFIADRNIRNIVSLSGDWHANIAGMARESSAGKESTAGIPEFVVAGISSLSMYRILRLITAKDSPFYEVVAGSGKSAFPLLNNTFMNGAESSLEYERTGYSGAYASPNPHLDYVDTNATGYGLLRLDGSGMRVSLITMADPLIDSGEQAGKIERTANFYLQEGRRKAVFYSMIGDKPYLDLQDSSS